MSGLLYFLTGVVFALGLGISGMTQPSKVTGFLDFTGNWDPSLMFVMVGAILVYGIGYRFVMKRTRPALASEFQVPQNRALDRNLILDAVIFGIGWGLSGFCPGPALTSLVTLRAEPLLFVGAMLAGMAIYERFW